MKLFRPVGLNELSLIKKSGMKEFPPRLPEQPIFYPVLNIEYARQIAKDWNSVSAPNFVGFVTEFLVDDDYISKFEIKTEGNNTHKELRVLAEKSSKFNNHIIDKIKVIEAHYGNQYTKVLKIFIYISKLPP
jgi:ribosomal protein S8